MHVPEIRELIEDVMLEAYRSKMTFHFVEDKMYIGYEESFIVKVNKQVSEYVARCLTCRKSRLSKRNQVDYYFP